MGRYRLAPREEASQNPRREIVWRPVGKIQPRAISSVCSRISAQPMPIQPDSRPYRRGETPAFPGGGPATSVSTAAAAQRSPGAGRRGRWVPVAWRREALAPSAGQVRRVEEEGIDDVIEGAPAVPLQVARRHAPVPIERGRQRLAADPGGGHQVGRHELGSVISRSASIGRESTTPGIWAHWLVECFDTAKE